MYVAEVRRDDIDLAAVMSHMRSWLDHRQIVPRLFRIDSKMFRLEFANEAEAIAFAVAFHGHVVGEVEPQAA